MNMVQVMAPNICNVYFQEPEIVKLQAFVRSNKAKHDYRALSKCIDD